VSGSKVPCSKKLFLLKEYVASLGLHNKDVREYAEFVRTEVDGDLMALVKKRMGESLERAQEHRKRYVDHIHEHGCEGHAGKPE